MGPEISFSSFTYSYVSSSGRAAYCLSVVIANIHLPIGTQIVHAILDGELAGYELYTNSLQETDLPVV